MIMTDADYTVYYSKDDNKILVASHMGTWMMDYPYEISCEGKAYYFDGKIPSPDWAIGNYFSCAEYVRKL